MRYVLGILVFLGFLYLSIVLAAGFDVGMAFIMFDLLTAVFMKAAVAAVIIATGGLKTFIMAINAVLSKSYFISAADKEKAIRLFKLISKTIIYATVIFTTLGLIMTFFNASMVSWQGEETSLGLSTALIANLAISFLTIFYGAVANLIFVHPVIYILESRENLEDKIVISEKQVIDKMLELCYKQGISPEEIVNASEITFRRKQ